MTTEPVTSVLASDDTDTGLKPSKYNYFVKYEDGDYYGYNFLYRSIVRVPDRIYAAVQQLLSNGPISEDVAECVSESVQALRTANFIVDRNLDEMKLMKFRYFRNLYANDYLSLVVLPTLHCNFCCPYCFEFKKPVHMTEDVQAALVRWVETFKDTRHLHIAWFGGEPLLAKKTISKLSDRFQSYCSRIGASYSASLVTNGYFLDPQFQRTIGLLRIGNIQITLDGEREAHDKSRHLKNGKGSFDRIYQNVVSLCENHASCDLTLRINCSDDNYAGVENLLTEFPSIVRSRARVYFRWVFANEATGYVDFSRIGRASLPYEGLSQLYRTAMSLGWRTKNPLGEFRNGYCDMDKLNHFQVDPEGRIYLCTHTFKPTDAIGSVLDNRGAVSAHSRYLSWYDATPFEDEKCIECILLPLCYGGCRKKRVEGGRLCTEESKSTDLYVADLVRARIREIKGFS